MRQHLKRYFAVMLIGMVVLLVASIFIMLLVANYEGQKYWFFPASVGYFAVITSLLHVVIVRSIYKDPRSFVRNFLMLTVGYLLLNLFVILIFVFTHLHNVVAAKYFTLTFLVLYLLCLMLEAVSLSLFVLRQRKEARLRQQQEEAQSEKEESDI